MIGERPIGVDATRDDLGHHVGDDEVDALECGDDGLLGRGQGGRLGGQPDVRTATRRGLIDRPPQHGERTLGPGGHLLAAVDRPRRHPRSGPRVPALDLQPGIGKAVGELAAHRDVDPQQVDARGDAIVRLIQRIGQSGLLERRPDPRPIGIAQHLEQLAPGDAIRVHPVEGAPDEPVELCFGDGAPIRLAEQLGLGTQVDRAGGDLEGQLLRGEVVFDEGHRERHRDPAREASRVRREVVVDDLAGERPPRAVEPTDAEQPQQRPLLADRGRTIGRHAPRDRDRRGLLAQRVEIAEVALAGRHGPKYRARPPVLTGRVGVPSARSVGGCPTRVGLRRFATAGGHDLADTVGEGQHVERLALERVAAGFERRVDDLALQ
jgi:hypothetical protein